MRHTQGKMKLRMKWRFRVYGSRQGNGWLLNNIAIRGNTNQSMGVRNRGSTSLTIMNKERKERGKEGKREKGRKEGEREKGKRKKLARMWRNQNPHAWLAAGWTAVQALEVMREAVPLPRASIGLHLQRPSPFTQQSQRKAILQWVETILRNS